MADDIFRCRECDAAVWHASVDCPGCVANVVRLSGPKLWAVLAGDLDADPGETDYARRAGLLDRGGGYVLTPLGEAVLARLVELGWISKAAGAAGSQGYPARKREMPSPADATVGGRAAPAVGEVER